MNMNSFRPEGGDENMPQDMPYHWPDMAIHTEGSGDDGNARKADPQQPLDPDLSDLEKRRAELIEELRVLEQRRRELKGEQQTAVMPQSACGGSLLSDPALALNEIVRHLAAPKAEEADSFLQVESEFPDELRRAFSSNATNAIVDFIKALYDQRLALHEKESGESAEITAARLKYINSEEMDFRLVGAHASRLARNYQRLEHIQFSIKELTAKLDADIGSRSSTIGEDVSADILEQIYRMLTRFTYDVVLAILTEEAKANTSKTGKQLSVEEYANEYAGKDLPDLLLELTEYTALEIKGRMHIGSSGQFDIDGRLIRHTARNALTAIVGSVELMKEGIEPAEAALPTRADDQTFSVVRAAIQRCAYERDVLRAGFRNTIHRKLPREDLHFIQDSDLIVRLAGYDADGKQLSSPEADFRLFEKLEEKHFLQWKQPFIEQPNAPELTKEQRQAIQRFHKEGGHVAPMSREAIEFIHEHGVIFFIEKKIQDFRLTLGSISALSRTPTSEPAQNEDSDNPDSWHLQPEVLKLFPQYDLAGVRFPEERPPEGLQETVKERILICRSSVISALGPDVWEWQCEEQDIDPKEVDIELEELRGYSLRRLGLAARLKAELFEIAKINKSKYLTFNIGTLIEQNQNGLDMINKPSSEHNRWVGSLGWRQQKSDIGSGVRMWWWAYSGMIERGMEEFYREHGLLKGKGWDIDRVRKSAQSNAKLLLRKVLEKEHSPW